VRKTADTHQSASALTIAALLALCSVVRAQEKSPGAALTLRQQSYIQAQTPGTEPIADHPSNGIVEIVATPIAEPTHEPRALTDPPEVFLPWRGLLSVAIRNVSREMVTLDAVMWTREYVVEVLDSSGKPVPLTDYGKSLADVASRPRDPHSYSGPAARVTITPGQESTTKMDVSQVFQVAPGTAYKIRIRRSAFLPSVDEYGKPIAQRELSCTVTIDAAGVLKAH